ncbi:hypothetical protein NE237_011584 [Protea cynaroides]|uniref:Auxin efflux carrier component n=1 Tax=Protea cynaroides TaxID=273540 RepID=A0A9Q0GV78_9MAGN|nr:hypothetical protein NE237_011584 [Protea cynaroides]
MISLNDLYSAITAVVPLYVTMLLAYFSVKWWKIITPDQCAGINRFAVPLLSFEFISRINPYKMDLLFIAADGISKVLILFLLFSWAKFSKQGSLDWVITLFSLSTLPNTLVMGIPLLKSMYGVDKEGLMIQVVIMQCIVWYALILVLFEYREARILIMQKLNGNTISNTERIMENEGGIQKARNGSSGAEDEVVHMVVTRPLTLDSDSQTIHNFNKVSPESEGCSTPWLQQQPKKMLKSFTYFFGDAGVCEQSLQPRHKEDETKRMGAEEETSEAVKVPEYSSSISSEMLKLILKTVWFKLVRNPNSYASLLGLSWALASCRSGIKKPQIMENSVTILSNADLGMAMFSLGLFMAVQPRIIACGKRLAVYGMLMRFVAGAVMSVASIGVGLRGTILRVSIVQGALPEGIVRFVFARDYNLHPDVLSTALSPNYIENFLSRSISRVHFEFILLQLN